MKNSVKTNAKAVGVKGVVVNDNNVILTSFGKGSKANIETIYDGTELDEKKIVLDKTEIKDEKHAKVTSRNKLTATVALPLKKEDKFVMKNNLDFLNMKPNLEQYFFGQAFEQSNIPVQIAYQILDIEKIMSSHINNIVYTMNNLMGFTDENEDIIGGIGFTKNSVTFKDFSNNNFSGTMGKLKENYNENSRKISKDQFVNVFDFPRLAYISNDFAVPKGKITVDDINKVNQNIYYAILLLGFVRQALAHKDTSSIYNIASIKFEKDNATNSFGEAKKYLEETYANGVAKLNCEVKNNNKMFSKGSFEVLAKNNIYYLAKAFYIDLNNRKAINTLAKDYYDYIVRMEGKNMGFSIKKLREILVNDSKEKLGKDLADKAYDTFRSKLYTLIDFTVFYYYKNNSDKIDVLVNRLRQAKTEEDKARIYINEVKSWDKSLLKQISFFTRLSGASFSSNIKFEKQTARDKERLNFKVPEIQGKISGNLNGTNADYFVTLIYFLTKFIDAKEINDLLTTLINKFENIQSFIELYNNINGTKLEFSDNAKMFEGKKCQYIATKLREVKCFARMETPDIEVKATMKEDALAILGKDYNNEKEKEEIDKYLVKIIPSNLCGDDIQDRGVLNFIMNNVVSNKRFQYLVRYADANSVHKLAKKTELVKFVLSSMPDSQIDKYYAKVTDIKSEDNDRNKWIAEILGLEYAPKKYQVSADEVKKEDKLELLAKLIYNFDFDEIKDVKQKAKAGTLEHERKLVYKNSISLYLTVLYILVKNLVNVNSRYFLAFHCVERDFFYWQSNSQNWKNDQIGPKKFKKNDKCRYLDITKEKIGENGLNALSPYPNTKDHSSYNDYRNNVEHLNVVRNINDLLEGFTLDKQASYFAIYHYAMQYKLFNGEEIFESNKIYHTYSQKALNKLNLPFLYNKARYNALSHEKLFDMNKKEDSKK